MNRQKSPNKTKPQKSAPPMWPALALVVLLIGALVTLYAFLHRAPKKESAAQTQPTPPMTEQALKDTAWEAKWPPLPTAETPARPLDQVRAMYAFAARHPEVLEYAPCYCGCESGGHKSARDCFVKGRTAEGKPQWDEMGFI